MQIGLDMMGGDYAPLEAMKGIREYFSETNAPAHIVLIGDEDKITDLLTDFSLIPDRYTIVHAPEIIDMYDSPTRALKEKRKSSISVGFHLLATEKIDAFISAGNTGAMLIGSLYSLKPVEGVLRPTISTVMPQTSGATGLILDVGINSDCKPEHLNQFAVMGSVYAQNILGIDEPRVGLINIGEEEGKGNLLAQAAFPMLKENSHINFIGNIEGRDLMMDKADVMVCDGFTGNIILKYAESLFEITQQKQIDHKFFKQFSFEIYGGTPVLGISKPVIIGHGISHAMAFRNMILLAEKMINKDVMQKMHDELIS